MQNDWYKSTARDVGKGGSIGFILVYIIQHVAFISEGTKKDLVYLVSLISSLASSIIRPAFRKFHESGVCEELVYYWQNVWLDICVYWADKRGSLTEEDKAKYKTKRSECDKARIEFKIDRLPDLMTTKKKSRVGAPPPVNERLQTSHSLNLLL